MIEKNLGENGMWKAVPEKMGEGRGRDRGRDGYFRRLPKLWEGGGISFPPFLILFLLCRIASTFPKSD